MRWSIPVGSAACLLLAAAGCAAWEAGRDAAPASPPIRLAPPALQAEPTAKLSGMVYVAREAGLDAATQKPPGYTLLSSGGTVGVWLASCAEPCARLAEAPIVAGAYAIDGLPVDQALVVEASGPGVSRRRVMIYLRSDTLLDFAADPGRSTGPYLVDSPEVVAVEPAPGETLGNSSTLRFRITYSEALDPDSIRPGAFRLTSADVPGLAIEGDSPFLSRTASVSLDGPATVVFEIPGPVAAVADPAGAAIALSVGKGTAREVAAGRVVASGSEPLTVSGLAWAPGGAGIGYRLAGDQTPPSLLSAGLYGASAEGVRLRMRWSEPMAAMLGAGAPQGRVGAGVLDPGAYEFRTAKAKSAAAADVILRDLVLDPDNPAIVTALATGSALSLGFLEIVPSGVADPAGNPASGSVRVGS